MAGESVREVRDCSRERWEGPGEAVSGTDYYSNCLLTDNNYIPPNLLDVAAITCVNSVWSLELSVRVRY